MLRRREDEGRFPGFRGGGESGALLRSIDWAKSTLGPVESWPRALVAIVGTLLHSRHPMFLWWGPELIQFYNDAYLPSFGRGKHPRAFGQPGRECWPEIWPIIWPQIEAVMTRGEPSWNEDHLVPIERNDRVEEVYWTYGYSPVYDDRGELGGTLVVCTETTVRVLSEQRLRTLAAIGSRTTRDVDFAAAAASTASSLTTHSTDVAFALVYEPRALPADMTLVASAGLTAGLVDHVDGRIRPRLVARDRDIGARTYHLGLEIGQVVGHGGDPISEVVALPLGDDPGSVGWLVIGVNPRLPFDGSSGRFLEQAAELLTSASIRIKNYRAHLAANDDRNALVQELEAANRTKDEFLAMLGHELRNPLSPIVTALQLMKLRDNGSSLREQAIIERQVDHLVRLVDDLLDVSKITRGKVELQKDVIETSAAIVKGVEIASLLLEQRGHEMTMDVPRTGLPVHCDPVRLAQVVANLLTNAARYTQPGGHVRVTAERQQGEVVISVKDSGIGISPELLPNIFDLFVQGKRSVDRAEGGLGIGLTLVKNLVGLHGGSVTAHSEGVGKGSEFVVRLPLARERPAPVVARPRGPISAEGSSVQHKRLLVVDDNSDAAESLGILLRSWGHEVAIVNDPLQALTLAKAFHPEIAVLDIGMPVMDGYELAAQLRQNPNVRSCRLFALTGYGQEHDRLRAAAAGFIQHFVKPVDLEKLRQAIDLPICAS